MDSSRLADWLTETVAQWHHQQLGPVTELAGGWESDIFRFRLDHSGGTEDLVLRRYAGDNGSAKARHEFGGMAKLHAFGYPVPRVIAAEPDPEPLGRPFLIMDWVPGDADRSRRDALQGEALTRFVGLQADLHRLAWQPFVGDIGPRAGDTIEVWAMLTKLFPDLDFDVAMRWLTDHVGSITPVEPAVIHWDFHVGNVLIATDGTTHVVDWTQIAVTDPRFDVAWTELLIAMAVGDDDAARFRTEYERQTQPLEDMAFFETAAAVKRLFSVAVSLHAGPETLGMRPEAAGRMRRDAQTLALPAATLERHTGITVPAVQDLLDNTSPA